MMYAQHSRVHACMQARCGDRTSRIGIYSHDSTSSLGEDDLRPGTQKQAEEISSAPQSTADLAPLPSWPRIIITAPTQGPPRPSLAVLTH